jgi:hypothetical protein
MRSAAFKTRPSRSSCLLVLAEGGQGVGDGMARVGCGGVMAAGEGGSELGGKRKQGHR